MKIRNGFVSNSSSSSFFATLTMDRFNKLELSAAEQAVIDELAAQTYLEDIEIIIFSSIMGNYDDIEDVDFKTFAKSVISYAEKNADPMLEEYKSELIRAELTPEEKAAAKIKSKGSVYDWDYFFILFDNTRESIIKRFIDLKNNKMCIIKQADF